MRNRRLLACLVAGLALFPGLSSGQTYPSKPFRIVIPFAPGGSSDANARIISERLAERLGQAVIIDTKPGANTIIGTDHVAKSAPDGYTVLLTSTSFVVNPVLYAKLPYDPLKDLVPITILSFTPQAIVTHPGFPAKTTKELIALAKAQPGKISIGSADSSSLLTGHLFCMLAGVDMQSVNYKGAGPLMIDVVGGHVAVGISGISSVQGQVRAGRAHLVGVASTTPSPIFPNASPIGQADLPGFDVLAWFGVFAPSGTPKDIQHRIHRDLVAVLQNSDVRQRLIEIGAEPGGPSQEEFDARVRKEIAMWATVVKAAGIKPQ
ncbi:MAG: tripartite tricarboxylate transporter substrate binding protein [Betaproteobacteria bacterium]|nr:tripartite tricarboxylate transporter substrate binding protein [Betaproteobacteria bacterium]